MATITDILTRDEIAAMTRPLESASAPPPAWYVSPELYALEKEHIFLKEWLWVGHAQDVAKPGDFITFTYADEPILVTRDQAGELHAFSNVCRHRGAIVAHGSGTCRSFTCPYHSWTYGLDGELLGAPEMNGVEKFDPNQFGLRALKVEDWYGNIMVNFDPECLPLSTVVGDLDHLFQKYDTRDLVVTSRRVYEIPCNWKMLVENNMEAYHFLGTHKAPGAYNRLKNWSTVDGSPDNTFNILVGSFEEALTMNVPGSGEAAIACLPGLTEEDKRKAPFVTLYPTSFWPLQADSVVCGHFVPDGVAKTKWIANYCFPESTVARTDFQEIEAAALEGSEGFINEDHEVLEQTYRGYQSRGFSPGPLSLHERNIHRFVQWVLSRLPSG